MDTNDHSNDTVGENPSVDVGDNPTENEPMSNSQEIEATGKTFSFVCVAM